MCAQPLVSVLLNAADREAHVGPALQSILAQTYGNIELVVATRQKAAIEAHLTSATVKSLRIVDPPQRNATAAFNHLMQHATGEYVAFSTPDYQFSPDKIAVQVEVMQARRALGACFTYVRYTDVTGVESPVLAKPFNVSYTEEALAHRMLQGNVLVTATAMLRRSHIEELGEFDETLAFAQDFDYWFRSILQASVHIIPQAMVTCILGDADMPEAIKKHVAHENWQVICRHAGGIMRRWPLLPQATHAFLSHVADMATVAEDWQVVVDYLNIKRQCFGHDDGDCLRIVECLLKQDRMREAEYLLRSLKAQQHDLAPDTRRIVDQYIDRLGVDL